MTRLVPSRPITESAFRPFGFLLESPRTGVRENFVATIFNGRASAKTNLALVQEQPAVEHFSATTLERHPLSTQSFFPLSVKRYLVVVCGSRDNGDPDLDSLSAFECRGDQAVSYAAGTWHMGIKTLDAPGVFAMLIHEDNSAVDCEFREVEPFDVRVSAG
ncbi:MAG: ureidoglycolate lyase [Gammaproteobacteria bacterium]